MIAFAAEGARLSTAYLYPYVGVVHEEGVALVVVVEVVQQHEEAARGVRGGRGQQLVVEQLQQPARRLQQVLHVRVRRDRHVRHVHLEGTVQDLQTLYHL